MNAPHLHLMVNHLPVLGTLFGAALLIAALALRDQAFQKLALAYFVLLALGGIVVYPRSFADQHRFTQLEILKVINRSKKKQAELIITTQKDAVRFPKIDRRDLPIYFMRVEIKIIRGASDFQDCVRRICFR